MGAGKVDLKNLWKNAQNRSKPIRWRLLKCKQNGAEIRMFGYACEIDRRDGKIPAWFGYPEGALVDAPCAHCGQVGMFATEEWTHQCPGHHAGKMLPCLGEHTCQGEPSMSWHGVPLWRGSELIEIPT